MMRTGVAALFSLLCLWPEFSAAEQSKDLTDLPLEELTNTGLSTAPKNLAVSTASKYAQISSRAPAALRVVTAEDIRTYGYRTLAEALRSLPGVYVTNDRNYSYVGVRGFGRPGDYNSRVLLMVDGQRINDDVYDSAQIGNEFPVDVDLIERIEFSPGPGSAIYGNNAFFGVINVITKRGNDFNGAELSGEYGGFDTYKARGSYGKRYENGAEVLLSATGFDREGPKSLYYPQFDTPSQNHGIADSLDGDRYHSAFGKLSWQGLTLEGGYIDRVKEIPTASFGQKFNDPGSHTEDENTFVALNYQREIAQDWNAFMRLNYNQAYYNGDYIYTDPPPRTINKDFGAGQWWGGEFRLVNTSFKDHKLVFGTEFQDNLRQLQRNYNLGGQTFLDKPFQSTRYGFYLQDEFQILDSLSLTAGARYDFNPLGGGSANPRVALIWQALDTTTLKLIYGTAFRAPNAYERFYADGASQKANAQVMPETVKTLEFVAEHFFTPSTRVSATAYHYEIDKLINQAVDPKDGFTFYENLGTVVANGFELDGEQRFRFGLLARLSYSWQRALDQNQRELTNSPRHQIKLNLSTPIWTDQWRAGFETQYFSARFTNNGSRVGDYVLSNLTLSGEVSKNLLLSAGVYNLWNTRFADPVGNEIIQNSIVQDGISFRIKLNLRY
jgi:outer membrane receptor protein involved in Fe transport